MVRTGSNTLQSQALQRFQKNESTIRAFEKSAVHVRPSTFVRKSKSLSHKHSNSGPGSSVPFGKAQTLGIQRNVTLMRAIYSEARWRLHAGVFAQPETAATQPAAADPSESHAQQSGRKLKSTFRAVYGSARQVVRGHRSMLTWCNFHKEELARKMIEEVKKDLEEGKITTFEDAQDHISGVIKQLFPDDTQETRQLVDSFNKAATNFKVMQQQLDRVKNRVSVSADALSAMMGLAKRNVDSVNSKVDAWNGVKADIERIRRASIDYDSSLTLGSSPPKSSISQPTEPPAPPPSTTTTTTVTRTDSEPSEPQPPSYKMKRAIIRHHTTAPQLMLHTDRRALRRALTVKDGESEAIDTFLSSISSVRANLKAALFAKRAAKRARTQHRMHSAEALGESSKEVSSQEALAEKAVEELEELLCHAALSSFQGTEDTAETEVLQADGELQGQEVIDEEVQSLPELSDDGPSQPMDGTDDMASSPAPSSSLQAPQVMEMPERPTFEVGMKVMVIGDGTRGNLLRQQLGFWAVLCEDGETRIYREERLTLAMDSPKDSSPDDASADEDDFGHEKAPAPPSGGHGSKRSSWHAWQRAKDKLALIKNSSIILSSMRHREAAEDIAARAQLQKEAAKVKAANWQIAMMQSDGLDLDGPLHLMEEHAERSQAWRHHVALLAAQDGSGGIEAIVADRHRRDFIIRSAAGPETDGGVHGVEVHVPPPRFACGNWDLSSVVPQLPITPPPSREARAFGRSLDGPLVGSARTQSRTPAPITVHSGAPRKHPEFFSPFAGETRWPPLPGNSDESSLSAAGPSQASSRGIRSPPSTPATAAGKAPSLHSRLWRLNLVTVDEPWAIPRTPQAGQRRLRSRGS